MFRAPQQTDSKDYQCEDADLSGQSQHELCYCHPDDATTNAARNELGGNAPIEAFGGMVDAWQDRACHCQER